MDACSRIREIAGYDQISHAWLVLGEDSEERTAVSTFLAKTILCESTLERPCCKCTHCRKVDKGFHPDMITTKRLPEKRELTVEQIRGIRQEAFVLPNEAAAKVFILPEADTMNQNAQNAFLKVLEEPPAYAFFLLLGQNPGSFLETIRSRCQELRLHGEKSTEQPSESAAKLAECFINGDRLGYAAASFKLEKLEKEKFDQLLDDLYLAAGLRARVAEAGKREAALVLCSMTERLREMRKVYVSPGHCLGWLGSFINNSVCG